MTETISFKLQVSKTYLWISILIHGFTLINIWFSGFNIFINLALSAILVGHFQYLNRHIFLKRTDSILKFSLADKKLITLDKTGIQQQYPCVYCSYQSQFLVIIKIGKRSLVIFKDAFETHSLSQLNRLLNA